MTTVTDEQLSTYANRVQGKVVIITGAANGIGKETALLFGKHGAKVVIGDLDIKGAETVVSEITQAGGQAICHRCDVTNWDEQVSMFELAVATYGSVDIVVPNAGVSELGLFSHTKLVDGKPTKPLFKTIEINLIAVMCTTHLALHYMKENKSEGDLKSIIFIGSMASWQAITGGPMYSASKHAILGFMRSIYDPCLRQGIRVGVIHPFFADTAIVPIYVKIFMAGIPLTPTARIAGAVFYAATDPDMETSGCPWLLPDDGYVFRLDRENLKQGVYGMIDQRAKAAIAGVQGVKGAIATLRDLWKYLGRQIFFSVLVVVAAQQAYKRVNI